MHVYSTVCDNLKPAGAGCSSEMYTAFLTHRLLERTLWLIAKHRKAAWLEMDRNVAVPVEPQASTIVWTTVCGWRGGSGEHARAWLCVGRCQQPLDDLLRLGPPTCSRRTGGIK